MGGNFDTVPNGREAESNLGMHASWDDPHKMYIATLQTRSLPNPNSLMLCPAGGTNVGI